MDDLFVPIQHLSNFKDVKEKLIFLGFENITRWEGNTYDHEQNISAQLQDIKKLEVIFENCLNISEDSFQKYLSELAIDNIKLILNHADIVMNDKNLSEKEMNEIIIGEKNLRVVADKI